MEESVDLIFAIISSYHTVRLNNHFARGNKQDLLARNDQGMRPVEYAIRLLAGTDDAEIRAKREDIVLILIEAATGDEIYVDAFEVSDGNLLDLAIESGSAAIVRALVGAGAGLDPFSLATVTVDVGPYGNKSDARREESLVSRILLSGSVWDQLAMLAALLNSDEAFAGKLVEFTDAPDEPFADVIVSTLGPLATASLIVSLLTSRKREAAACLITLFPAEAMNEAALEDFALYEFLDLSIDADRVDIIRACTSFGIAIPRGPELLLSAIHSSHEEAAIALVDAGVPLDIEIEMDFGDLDASFLPPSISVTPFYEAIDEEMNRLLGRWFNTPSFQEVDFLSLLRRSYDGYNWLLENPDVAGMLADSWEPAPRAVQSHLRGWLREPREDSINWSVETFWPTFIRSYANTLDLESYVPIDLQNGNRRGQSPAYWLLDAALFMQTTGNEIHIALGQDPEGDRARLYQFNPTVLRQIHAIGISPAWICTTAAAAFRDMDEGARRAREIGEPEHEGVQVLTSVVAANCTAALDGLKDFMATLRALGEWRGIINYCLSSLKAAGDPVAALRAFAEEPTVPDELRLLAVECIAELEALLKGWTESRVLTLHETIMLDYVAKFGLDECTYDTLTALIGDRVFLEFILNDQSLLNLLVVFAQERGRVGRLPNPMACFAMWRLLEDYPQLAAFRTIYAGIAELEPPSEKDDPNDD